MNLLTTKLFGSEIVVKLEHKAYVEFVQEKTKKSESVELTNEVDLLMKEMVDDGKELEEKRERDLLEIATELKKRWPELQKAFGPQRRKILDEIVEGLPSGNSYIPALKDPRPISYTIFRNVLVSNALIEFYKFFVMRRKGKNPLKRLERLKVE